MGPHCIETKLAELRSEIDCSPNREWIKIINVIWKITSYMESEGETGGQKSRECIRNNKGKMINELIITAR